MATVVNDNIDYRLLERLNDLVICSRCLQHGRVTPVPQVFSASHRPTNLCGNCRSATATAPRPSGKLLRFRQRP